MVETKSNYTNGNKRYNKRSNYRKYNSSSNTNMKKKGILSFLFSFEGKISKNLYTGIALTLACTSFALDLVSMLVNDNKIFNGVYSFLNALIIVSVLAIGYKRAHSFGISGFYSIVGSVLFKPFFCFYKPERDFAADIAYKNHFTKLKKIGAFFDKNFLTRLLYIAILSVLALVPYLFIKKGTDQNMISDIVTFISIITAFNVIQLIFVNSNWIKRIYVNIVKVCSFVGYSLLVMAITVFFYSAYILMAMMQATQNMPK